MSTPNPLIPQGTFQAQAVKGASNVRIAVATIVAIHVVFFGGLLLQGCKRDTTTAQTDETQAPTNTAPSTNIGLPPLDSSSLYYSSSSNLPTDAGAVSSTGAGTTSNAFAAQSSNATPDAMWQTTNLQSTLANQTAGGSQASGATREYTVVRGDSYARIAKTQRTTVSALRAANPNVEPARIKPGDKLNVPEAAPQTATPSAEGTGGTLAPSTSTAANTYTVKAGDTLTKIARSHGVTIAQLRAANANTLKTSRVNVGQKLKIPAPSPSQVSTGTTSRPGL